MKYQHKHVELAKKVGIPQEDAVSMILCHHEIEKLIPKSRLKKIKIDLDDDAMKMVQKISKGLKISTSAVIACTLIKYLDDKEGNGRSS